jgi:DNA-binding transcriptional regulator PaaX
VIPHDRLVWSGGLVTLLGEFGFSTSAARVALARMVRRGSLDRSKAGRLVSYRSFIDEFSHTVRRSDDREAFLLRTRLVHDFRRFPALDPELPDELMHAPRHRAKAVALFHRLYAALAPAAQRHFNEVTTAP